MTFICGNCPLVTAHSSLWDVPVFETIFLVTILRGDFLRRRTINLGSGLPRETVLHVKGATPTVALQSYRL